MSELTMGKIQREAFLADLHVGVVTIARADEAPLAVPVWYSYEPGGDVQFVFESTSEKIKLLRATGEASLCVQNESMPYKYVVVSGPTVVGDTDEALERSLAHRYLGAEIGDVYLAAIQDTVSYAVRLTPTRWRTVDYSPMVDALLGTSPT
jgi:PPOX class probable F420-dependent enzyme